MERIFTGWELISSNNSAVDTSFTVAVSPHEKSVANGVHLVSGNTASDVFTTLKVHALQLAQHDWCKPRLVVANNDDVKHWRRNYCSIHRFHPIISIAAVNAVSFLAQEQTQQIVHKRSATISYHNDYATYEVNLVVRFDVVLLH